MIAAWHPPHGESLAGQNGAASTRPVPVRPPPLPPPDPPMFLPKPDPAQQKAARSHVRAKARLLQKKGVKRYRS